MNEQPVVVERDGSVATVRIDRPKVHNALNATVLGRLQEEIGVLGADQAVRAIVITGTGEKAFSAGADLGELEPLDATQAYQRMRAAQAVFRGIEQSQVPTIAAVNGLALGGGFELALACSFAVLAKHATLGLPESALGLMPGYGGTQRLARIAGPNVARHVMLTGQRLDAQRAYELGIAVLPPTEPADLLPTAYEIAGQISARGPLACRAILEAVDRGRDVPLDTALAVETGLAAMAIGGNESTEGVAAFLEKRPPNFEGGQ